MSDKKTMGIKSYAEQAKARNAERRASKEPVFPNLAQAGAQFDPQRDAPQTLSQMGAEQRATDQAPTDRTGLSEETVRGLVGLREAQDRVLSQRPDTMPSPPPQAPQDEAGPGPEMSEEDTELMSLLRAMREDPINNAREREAVRGRVKPMDIAEGLLTGEYTQVVPVIPGKLTVTFRSMSHLEHQMLRVKLYNYLDDHPELRRIDGELLGFYQTVASIKAINDTVAQSHLQRQPNGTVEFLDAAFEEKLARFNTMPIQLISTIGIHGAWFDARVRDLFVSAEALKNG
jgi:hypothetical protein